MAARANRLTVIHQLASTLSASDLEQLKLERLRELRSTIDALRVEQEAGDPLRAWAIDREQTEEAAGG